MAFKEGHPWEWNICGYRRKIYGYISNYCQGLGFILVVGFMYAYYIMKTDLLNK